jgi:glycosyltransferase involved in cell wall biosynthesis
MTVVSTRPKKITGVPNRNAIVRADGSVAVVMRTKNRPLLLPRALESALAQSWQNLHLYLVNDGGSRTELDRSLEPYIARFGSRITIISHETSLGMENASNSALEIATEEFAVIHDDDDSWHPEFLARTVGFLQEPDNSIYVAVTTRCEVIIEALSENKITIVERRKDMHQGKMPTVMRELLCHNQFPPICMLIRRRAISEIGLFNGQLPVQGDWDFNQRLLLIGDIGHVEEYLSFYHLRAQIDQPTNYGNTIIDGRDVHEKYRTIITNASLRKSLTSSPELYGAVQAIMLKQHEDTKALTKKIVRLQKVIERIDGRIQRIDRRTSRKLRRRKWLNRLKRLFGIPPTLPSTPIPPTPPVQ